MMMMIMMIIIIIIKYKTMNGYIELSRAIRSGSVANHSPRVT